MNSVLTRPANGGHRRRRPATRRGVAAAELAVCLPILVLFVIGAIESCSMIYLDETLSVASYEGVRQAIRIDGTNTAAQAKIDAILTARQVADAEVTFDPADVAQVARGETITVSVSAPCSSNSLLPPWFFKGSITETSTMVKE